MIIAVLVLSALSVSAVPLDGVVPQNVVTVPPNCPDGQELINGECRDIWRSGANSAISPETLGDSYLPKNIITVPSNCPPGQQLINGQCRDVWRTGPLDLVQNSRPSNVITVPPNCPAGQELINGQCRDVWRTNISRDSTLLQQLLDLIRNANAQYQRQMEGENEDLNDDSLRNIISVPNQCPVGYRPDALGICRKIFV